MSKSQIALGTRGFHITFENGYTISTQFGQGNYCDSVEVDGAVYAASSVEIAVLDPKDEYVNLASPFSLNCSPEALEEFEEQVKGWVPVEDLPKIMQRLKEVGKTDPEGDLDSVRRAISFATTK